MIFNLLLNPPVYLLRYRLYALPDRLIPVFGFRTPGSLSAFLI
nr:MAG TPA: hypothetical protein [Bacteriophage sp.]